MRILLVAEESAGIQVLRGLIRTDHDLVAVMTTEPTRGGGATVASVAAAAGVPVQRSEEDRECEERWPPRGRLSVGHGHDRSQGNEQTRCRLLTFDHFLAFLCVSPGEAGSSDRGSRLFR